MADFGVLSGAGSEPDARNLSGSSSLVLVTSGSSAHTKGSYAELAAATVATMHGFWLHVFSNIGVTAWILLDIAIGAAGSEQVILPDVPIFLSGRQDFTALIPLEIPSGARVAARVQSSATSDPWRIGVSGLIGGARLPRVFQRATSYGFDSANSRGTVCDAGATINTYGPVAEVTPACTHPLKAAMLTMGRGSTANNNSGAYHLVDFGHGSSGSEVWDAPMLASVNSSTVDRYPAHLGTYCVSIPAGSRLAIRSRCTHAGADVRLGSVGVIGFD